MLITSIRYGRTFNTGNYTSEKIEIEVIPDSGQTAEDALAEVRAYVESKGPGGDDKPKSKPSSAPPLTKAAGSDPTTASTKGPSTKSVQASETASGGSEDPPFDAEPPKAKRGRKKKPDHEKELQYALDSKSLEELADRFESLRTMADCFGLDGWIAACVSIKAHYTKLHTAEPHGHDDAQWVIEAALTAERAKCAAEKANQRAAETVAA